MIALSIRVQLHCYYNCIPHIGLIAMSFAAIFAQTIQLAVNHNYHLDVTG